jgi:uncharacterized membrane protein YhfC
MSCWRIQFIDMDVPLITHFLDGFLMVVMPIGLAIYLMRRWKLGGRVWWTGAAAFICSQLGHIPFNWGIGKLLNQTGMISWNPTYQLIFNAVFLGLSAGIFEEVTRYLVLLWWAKDARSWRTGILFGTGHGGIEAIILGGLVLYSFFQMVALRNADLATVIPNNQLELAQKQVAAYWSANWYTSLLGALERLFTIPCQIAMAVMVMQVFTRKQARWLFLAIGYHAIIDASAVVNIKYLGAYWTEAILGGFAILSAVLILLLRQPEPPADILPSSPPLVSVPIEPPEETFENLEETRYQ